MFKQQRISYTHKRKQMCNEEFGWPVFEVPGRSLDFWNDRSVFVIHGGALEPHLSLC